MGSECFKEALELRFSGGELLAAGEVDVVVEGVVKLGQPHIVQDRCNVEIDQSQGVYVGELHAGAILAVELGRSPFFCAGITVDGGLILSTDVLGYAKVGQIHPIGL